MRLAHKFREAKFMWDWPLFAVACALCLISLVALRSASATLNPSLLGRQAIWIGLGIMASLFVASVPYTWWTDASAFLYMGTLVLLLIVELAGTVKLGAARWLTVFGLSLQPSELAKLTTACCLARYLANQPAVLSTQRLAGSAAVAGLPALLIFLQPDLGSSSVLGAIWLGAVWVAGLSLRQLTVMTVAGLSLLPVGWHVLQEYQRLRLLAFLNPHTDPLGAGYTIIQSQIAIGSGQFFGRGWMSGTQNQLNFLPERHADFLYSVIGEEWGFVGAVVVIVLFGCLLWRAIRIALDTVEPQGQFLAMALCSWMTYQASVNMGMVMGLLPVVGVPLPLVSYGGSAMITSWIALGLLQSLHRFGTRF